MKSSEPIRWASRYLLRSRWSAIRSTSAPKSTCTAFARTVSLVPLKSRRYSRRVVGRAILPAAGLPAGPTVQAHARYPHAALHMIRSLRLTPPGRWWIRHQRHPQAQNHEHHETMCNPHKVLSFGSPVRAGDRLPKHLEITAPRALVILHPLNLEPAPASPALVVAVYRPRRRVVHKIAPEFSDSLRQHISLCF